MKIPLVSLIAIVALAVGLGILVSKVWHWMRRRIKHMRCPVCGHRLSYRAHMAGSQGRCRQCGATVTFPK